MLFTGNSTAGLVEIGAAREARSDRSHNPRLAFHEAADVVAEMAVPLGPAVAGEMADLVQAGSVPGFRDHLRIGKIVVELDLPDHRGMRRGQAIFAARENGAFVEAEAIHVGFANPVLQAFHDELLADGVIAVESVAAPREIHVILQVPGHQEVVSLVVQALEREDRPKLVAFVGVIEDDIENDLDTGPVQRLHHVAEFAQMAAALGIHAITAIAGAKKPMVLYPQKFVRGWPFSTRSTSVSSKSKTGSSSIAVTPRSAR